MASSLKLLSRIDKRTKYSVHGWIRQIEHKLRLRQIPRMINAICILYLRPDETFREKQSKWVQLSMKDKCITKIKSGLENDKYGTMEIQSMSNMKCRWEFKINIVNPREIIGIGISSIRISSNGVVSQNEYDYSYWNNGVVLVKNEREIGLNPINDQRIKFCNNDKASMCLDLKKKNLFFMVNGRRIKTFEDIIIVTDKKVKYRMFVSLYTKGDSVEIIDFILNDQ